ncbi:MAG: class I SAM-dependent RNA methyltransferase [Rhodobacteraceae bacterium]|nr:class I SAM-dependent RNA methyltransferase [Paracoccaceae bacterium]
MSELEISIDRLGRQGDGIGTLEGRAIYAARTLPGEVVTGVLTGDRIVQQKILSPSSDRVAAACRHYKTCGGCAVQHASDGFVAGWKAEQVRRALSAQGLEGPIRDVKTSSARSRRRAVFTGRRTKTGAIVGFHGRASEVLVDVLDCHILDPQIMASLPVLRDLVVATASRKGTLTLAVTQSTEGLDVAVSGGKPLDQSLISVLTSLTASAGIARLSWGDDLVFLDRPPRQAFGPAMVAPPPGAFLQATEMGEAALVAGVSEALVGAKHVVDLFAGCGTFTLPLAATASFHAVEGDAAMLEALSAGWRSATGVKPVSTDCVEKLRFRA